MAKLEIGENKKINSVITTPKLKKSKMPYVFANMQTGSDLWTTPKYAVEILLPYIKKFKGKVVWCPFDNKDSMFVKVLSQAGFEVVYSHLEKGEDFFKWEPNKWDVIISNPPLKHKR